MISIIIPIYNDQNYIIECLESVKKQTYKDFECLCLDDGSNDNTITLIKNFIKEDKRFKLFQNNHKGPGWQRNFGIEKANGEFITFMDHDDFVEINWLKKLYDTLIDNNVDIAYCSNSDYFENSKKDVNYYFPDKLKGKIIFNNKNVPKDLVSCYFAPWRRLVKRDLLIQNKIHFAEGDFRFDDVLFTQILLINVNSAAFCNEILYHHRIFDNSITGNSFVNKDVFFEHFETAKLLKQYAEENNKDYKIILKNMFPLFSHYLFFVNSKREFYKKFKKLVFENKLPFIFKLKLLWYHLHIHN